MFCDGASKGNPGESSIGVYCTDNQTGEEKFSIAKSIGRTTNNVAEWTSLVEGLKKALSLEIEELEVKMDSELVVRQFNGIYKVKKEDLKPFFHESKELANRLKNISVTHIPREENKKADALANSVF